MSSHRRRCSLVCMALAGIATACVAHATGTNPCDPHTYGAAGDGIANDTNAIQTAIDTCAAQGGGTVPFDHGTFLTGPFTLKSHIVLRVSTDATILGTTDQS